MVEQPAIQIDVEDLGTPADHLLFQNQRLALDMLVVMAKKITGPFGGYVSITHKEHETTAGYRLKLYVKGIDPKTGEGKPTYNFELSPPPGWHAFDTKSGKHL